MTKHELLLNIYTVLKNPHFFYFVINLIAIILVAIFFAYKCSALEKQIDRELELQEVKIINKVINMFKEAFKLIKKTGLML